jgi:hypothetical protein
VLDIAHFDPDLLHIYSKDALALIRKGETGWESMTPPKVVALVKEKYLFGYPCEQMEFEY